LKTLGSWVSTEKKQIFAFEAIVSVHVLCQSFCKVNKVLCQQVSAIVINFRMIIKLRRMISDQEQQFLFRFEDASQ